MIDAIIFDLDSCISAADEPGRELFEPALRAIAEASQGHLSDAELVAAFTDIWRLPFDFVAQKHGFTESMKQAGWREFERIEVSSPMIGYGDLEIIAKLPVRRFLVTSGFRRLQESKIRALGIASLFDEVQVDAIDEPAPKGKLRIFEDLIARHRLQPPLTLIVGDNADSELAAGRKLGIRTVQTLRPGVPQDPSASHHITHFAELRQLLG